MKILKHTLLIVLVSSCATVNVNYDYERQTNFSEYTTYNYYSDQDTGLSALDSKRLLNVLDTAMAAKGMSLSENPDFFINIQSVQFQNEQRSTVGVGVGGHGGNVGGGVSVGIPIGDSKYSRELIFDFIDEDKGLFWQAVAVGSYNSNANPEKREANLKAIVDKVLAGYPPQ